ncbi:sugar transporter [Mycolicibacterium elephantis]|uniref:MFS transporter n=1 Tax=Mycolicibacterium elephantis TaxID=81858 RepID=UPI0007E9D0ED|nr:MFS transporter [Mycolicibacterium elephantis]OBE92903.1 sugar transporter [Mycolicibacterium elephantis]
MVAQTELSTITTQVPSRLDRLPWSRFHWRVVLGLGGVWILDGLEVTMVGNVASRLTEEGSGIELTAGEIGIAAAIYITGACLGALFFGQLTDRFGRKKLFILTLVVYLTATVATAFAFAPWYFYLARFFTGAGIGGEYAAINSAIDELIPARVRGRVDLVINGSYWLGAAGGAAGALLLLDTSIFPADIGWRIAFGLGAVFGLVVLVVRRKVPESPRWLFIHGHEQEAERIVDEIEREVERETSQPLEEPEGSITVKQRKTISFREIARVAFTLYPRRAFLCLALFIGQAFIYNAFTFNLGTILSTFFGVASGIVPLFFIVWALSNFAGPLVLGRLFDTIGRKPMISFAYIGSAVIAALLAWLFVAEAGGAWVFIAVLAVCFFLASSGASAAYLTVSEIFPMETRAMAIAFFYAVGTAIGGITGPLLFGQLIDSGERGLVATGFLIGATVMAVAGVVELVLGVKAEGKDLESLAEPLTTTDEQPAAEPTADPDRQAREARIAARVERQRASQSRSRRYRPGPAPGWAAAWREPPSPGAPETALDHEIESIARAVSEHEPITLRELHRVVGARYWGPGEFRKALREAMAENRIARQRRGVIVLPEREQASR